MDCIVYVSTCFRFGGTLFKPQNNVCYSLCLYTMRITIYLYFVVAQSDFMHQAFTSLHTTND
jgi:hypothetical protein